MKTKPAAFVILSPGFPEHEDDSTCLPAQQVFVRALKKSRPDLEIIVLTFHYPFYKTSYNWFGVQVIALGGKDKAKYYRVIIWLKALRILNKLNKQYQIVGLLSFWLGECAFVGNIFAKIKHLKHQCWILGQDAKLGNKYFKWIKPKPDELIALSDFIAAEVNKNYGILPAKVIPVGIDPSLFKNIPKLRTIDILGAGSLIPLKQYKIFIDAIIYLKQKFPNIKAVMCGKGPEMERLKEYAVFFGLDDNLKFEGELPHQEVLSLMGQTKIFLHPSNYEGFGAVLLEALYGGAHVVSFCKPMNTNFNHHYVVNTIADMNNTLSNLLEAENLNHDFIITFPIELVVAEILSLYTD